MVRPLHSLDAADPLLQISPFSSTSTGASPTLPRASADPISEPLPGRYSSIIDWESKPEQVAFHSSGLIFAFSPTMIEVRHASTGRLVQIITGSSIVLTYDGCGLDEGELEKRIHFSMKVGGYHTIYEIVPL